MRTGGVINKKVHKGGSARPWWALNMQGHNNASCLFSFKFARIAVLWEKANRVADKPCTYDTEKGERNSPPLPHTPGPSLVSTTFHHAPISRKS